MIVITDKIRQLTQDQTILRSLLINLHTEDSGLQ